MSRNSENAWMEDKITAKFINLQRPGDDIYIGCQGVGYLIKDGATVTVPKLVVEAANNACQTRWKVQGDLGAGKVATPYKQQRFMVVPVETANLQTKEEKKKAALVADIKGNDDEDDE